MSSSYYMGHSIPAKWRAYYSLRSRQEDALLKAERCDSTDKFIKHCHTLIHLCSESISKNQPDCAEIIYEDLCGLLKNTTCTFH